MRARGAKGIERERIARVLVWAPSWVGDAVLCGPAIAAIRRNLSHARLTVIARPWVEDLFRGRPDVDDLLIHQDPGRHQGAFGHLRLARDLRPLRFDAAILLRNAFGTALAAGLARIPHRIGYATDGRRLLLTHPLSVGPEAGGRHQVEYYLGIIRGLGWEVGRPDLQVPVGPADEDAAEALLGSAGIGAGEPVVALNPGAIYGWAKRWPTERFAALADRLADRFGVRIVVVGSARELAIATDLVQRMGSPAANLAGRTGLRTLSALLRRCRVLVTNDTGAMHLATAVGCPVVAIFGPTDPVATGPWGDGHRILRHPVPCSPCHLRACPIGHPCMLGITPEMVAESVAPYLRQGGGRRPLAPAVFLDRDGTINVERGFIKDPADVALIPGSAEAIRRIRAAGFKVVVVSNQAGVARGLLTEGDVAAVNRRLEDLLRAEGIVLDALYVCPHHPEFGEPPYRQACDCRKPRGGMVARAAAEHAIDLRASFVVGDHGSDVALGLGLGMRSALVLTGHGQEEWAKLRAATGADGPRPDHVAPDLRAATEWILIAAARPAGGVGGM